MFPGKTVSDGRRSLLLLPDTPEFSGAGEVSRMWEKGLGGTAYWHPLRLREGIWLIDAREVGVRDLRFGEAAAIVELQRALFDNEFIRRARMFCRTSASGMVVQTRALSFAEVRQQLTNFFLAALRRQHMVVVGRTQSIGQDLPAGANYAIQGAAIFTTPSNFALAIIRKRDLENSDQEFGEEITFSRLKRLLPDSAIQKAALDLLDGKESRPASSDGRPMSAMDQLYRAFQSGELILVRVPKGSGSGGATDVTTQQQTGSSAAATQPSQQSATTRRAKITPKTFIEIALRYEDTQQPAAGVRYRLQVTDGSVREGTLDNDGKARVTGIDPGNCVVTFPDLDSREWHPA